MKKNNFFQPSRLFTPIALSAIFSLIIHTASAELKLDNWITYTSLSNVNSADIDNQGKIWAGTTGGVFIYNPTDNSTTEIRNTEGLLNLNINLIKVNPSNNSVFICSSNGTIQIHNPDGSWNYITDILSAKFPDPLITEIIFIQDTAYISGGFGLSKFNLKELVFIETTNKFGTFTSGIRVNDILFLDDFIWIATDEGLARLKISNTIANPLAWETFNMTDGLNEKKVKFLLNFNDSLYLATEKSIYKFVSNKLTSVITVADYENITGLINLNNTLLYSTNIDVYNLAKIPLSFANYRNINAITKYDTNKIICLFQYWGLSIFENSTEKNILPNTAISNSFANLDVDTKGRLWVATRPKNESNGQGFMMFDGTQWHNFNYFTDNKINNWAMKIKATNNGDIYVSTWGGGLLKLQEIENHNETQFNITKFDTSNSPLTGALTTNPNYIICGETAEDSQGKIWTINYGEGSTGPLLTTIDNNQFTPFYNPENPTERQFIEFAIDAYSTKWLGSNNFAKGLIYFNDNNTPKDKSDDKFGKYTKSNSALLDNEITCIAIDKNDFIWLGTNSGLNFIYDPYPAKKGEKVSIREETHLRNQYINDIYIDPVNNKWIATNKGIWVLNDDASALLNPTILNSSNSPLIADEVLSITSNPKTGTFYFGTKFGLSSAKSLFAQPTTSYTIKCFPQPFNPQKDREMFIDGLMENSDIRILTLDGSLVRKLSAKGKLAYWDGKDEYGLIPQSGVYIIVTSSLSNDGRGYGKFTIINK